MTVVLVSKFEAATQRLYDLLATPGRGVLQVSSGDVSARFHNIPAEAADAWNDFIEVGGHGARQLQMVATQIAKQRGNVDLVADGHLMIQAQEKSPETKQAARRVLDLGGIDTQCDSSECDECNLAPLTTYLPPDQYQMLNELSSIQGISSSEFASQVLASAIDAMYCSQVRREVQDRREASRVAMHRARRLGKLRAFATAKLTGFLSHERQPKVAFAFGG